MTDRTFRLQSMASSAECEQGHKYGRTYGDCRCGPCSKFSAFSRTLFQLNVAILARSSARCPEIKGP